MERSDDPEIPTIFLAFYYGFLQIVAGFYGFYAVFSNHVTMEEVGVFPYMTLIACNTWVIAAAFLAFSIASNRNSENVYLYLIAKAALAFIDVLVIVFYCAGTITQTSIFAVTMLNLGLCICATVNMCSLEGIWEEKKKKRESPKGLSYGSIDVEEGKIPLLNQSIASCSECLENSD